MKSTIAWIAAIVFGVLLLALLPGMWMMGRTWMSGYGGMMGGFGGMHAFGWGGMFIGWLILAGVVFFLATGVFALVNNLNRSEGGSQTSPQMGKACPHCGKPVSNDWNTCPYCSQNLS